MEKIYTDCKPRTWNWKSRLKFSRCRNRVVPKFDNCSGVRFEWVILRSCFSFFRRLGHSDVFNLIHQHNLFNSIQDKIIMLMEFDKEVILMASRCASFESETRKTLTRSLSDSIPAKSVAIVLRTWTEYCTIMPVFLSSRWGAVASWLVRSPPDRVV